MQPLLFLNALHSCRGCRLFFPNCRHLHSRIVMGPYARDSYWTALLTQWKLCQNSTVIFVQRATPELQVKTDATVTGLSGTHVACTWHGRRFIQLGTSTQVLTHCLRTCQDISSSISCNLEADTKHGYPLALTPSTACTSHSHRSWTTKQHVGLMPRGW